MIQLSPVRFARLCFQTLIALALLSTGCQRFDDSYGDTRGFAASNSISGFATFRRGLIRDSLVQDSQRTKFDATDIVSLGERTESVDAIVWTPKLHRSISQPTRFWIERWLSSGGKTLVYVVPDRGSLESYLRAAMHQTDAPERMEYRRRVARESLDRLLVTKPQSRHDEWFDLVQKNRVASDTPVQSIVPPSFVDETMADDSSAEGGDTTVDDPQIQWHPLRSSGDDVLVAELTRDDWQDSRIIVVAAGSLVTNYAMAFKDGGEIVDQIRESIMDGSATSETEEPTKIEIAFASTDTSDLPVRDRPSNQPTSSGMEVLTTWPLSLVTIHGLIAGLIGCLILLPIFGRPRRTPRADPSRFGDHIDAVASLMLKTKGEAFAKDRIERYRKQMRREEIT